MREEPFEIKHPESLDTIESLRAALSEANAVLLSLSHNCRMLERTLGEMGGMLTRIMLARASGDVDGALSHIDQVISNTQFSVVQFEQAQGTRH